MNDDVVRLFDVDTVDFLGLEKDSGDVILTLVDDFGWQDEMRHMALLQEKINRYFDFIDSGEVYDQVEKIVGRSIPKSTPVKISVLEKYEPTEEGYRFLEHVKRISKEAGVDFTFKKFKKF